MRKVVCFVHDLVHKENGLVHEADNLVRFIRKLVGEENEVAESVDDPACNVRKAVHNRNESVFSVRKLENFVRNLGNQKSKVENLISVMGKGVSDIENFVRNIADDVRKSLDAAEQAENEPIRPKTDSYRPKGASHFLDYRKYHVPQGRLKCNVFSVVPSGLMALFGTRPGIETPGYFRWFFRNQTAAQKMRCVPAPNPPKPAIVAVCKDHPARDEDGGKIRAGIPAPPGA